MAFRTEIVDFAAFYERTSDAAYRTALGICGDPGLASDATQEAYAAAFRERDGFRGDVPAGAWLHRIVVNAAISTMRARRRIRWIDPLDDHAADPTGQAIDAADALSVRGALDHLEPRQRAAIVLRYYHDFDYATIAQILGTTTGTVGSLLSRSLERLRKDLLPMDPPATQLVVGAVTTELRNGH